MNRVVTAEKTRPDNTTAYAAEDVISEDDTNGAGTAWTFSNVVPSGGRAGIITKAIVHTDKTGLTAELTLYLFNSTPTSELDDNAGNSAPLYADTLNFVGAINFPTLEDLSSDSSYAVASLSGDHELPLPFKCASGDTNLYGVLVTRGAITPDSEQKFRLTLQISTQDG